MSAGVSVCVSICMHGACIHVCKYVWQYESMVVCLAVPGFGIVQ